MTADPAVLWLIGATILQTIALAGVGVVLWLVYRESLAARLERERRATGDQMTVEYARRWMQAFELLPQCEGCRKAIEKVVLDPRRAQSYHTYPEG